MISERSIIPDAGQSANETSWITRTAVAQFAFAVELLILKALCLQPMPGSSIRRSVLGMTNRVVNVREEGLADALRQLQERGQIISYLARSEYGRLVTFYAITDSGRVALGSGSRKWTRHAKSILAALELNSRSIR